MATRDEALPSASGRVLTLLLPRLQPGTGLGDHTLQVAAALQREGWQTEICNVSDASLTAPRDGVVWIQMVPYAWGRNGLLNAAWVGRTKALCADRPVVIYFHELWLGEERAASWKHRVLGGLQRWRVLRLVGALGRPRIFTSNPNYQLILAAAGLKSELVPLPSNLPEPGSNDCAAATAWLTERGLMAPEGPEIAVVFGAIHPEWDATRAVRSWLDDATRRGRTTVILGLGHHGPAGPLALDRLARATGVRIVAGGAVAAGLLAALIGRAALAFATSPWALIGKSGTIQAFRKLGVPVIVTRDDWRRRGGETVLPPEQPGLRRWAEGFDWAAFRAERGGGAEAFQAEVLAGMLAGGTRTGAS